MPAIRFPASALPLLSLCKGHGENFIFRTYADFMNLVVAYGFYLHNGQGHKIPTKAEFTHSPNPVSLEVFENRGLYAHFVMLALAYDGSRQIAEDEEQLATLIERYAYLGAARLSSEVAGKSDDQILIHVCELMSSSDDSAKI